MFTIETVVILGTLLVVTYWYVNRMYTYWKRRGIQYVEPNIPYGTTKGIFSTVHLSDLLRKPYYQMKGSGPFGGIYFFNTPIALLLDPKLIKNVLIKDFQYFMDRGVFYNKKDDPLTAHLFSLDAAEWKELRNKLTPTFTSGKMKYMYPTVTKVGNEFKEALESHVKTSDMVEIKDFLARFTTDVIGTCAFGIDCNSLRDPDAVFRKMGRAVFSPQRTRVLKLAISNMSATFARFIGLKLLPDGVSSFFLNAVKDTIDYREKNNVQRNDFMDLMIQLMDGTDGISFNEVAAQAFVFFLAGFETSSTLLTFTLYELALNPDIQTKARKEIADVLQKHKGEFTYEAMMDLKYIDQILNESLRKYPPVTNLVRRTAREYPVPDTNSTLEADTLVWIPIRTIQHDPEYYPDPEKFDPDRFTPEATAARDPMTFLPFGDGPRNCIGLRFGRMQARVGLVKILESFTVSTCAKTTIPLVIDPTAIILSPVGGMWLKLEKI